MKYFWIWYEKKGYEKVISKELIIENKSFSIGCFIEYLMENDRKLECIQSLKEDLTINGLYNDLKTGIEWYNL